MGITSPTSQELSLNVYLYLKKILPADMLSFLNQKADLDLEIGASSKHLAFKARKKELRIKYEDSAFHVWYITN